MRQEDTRTIPALHFLGNNIVHDLEFVGPLEFKLVAPMPEQIKTIIISHGELGFSA